MTRSGPRYYVTFTMHRRPRLHIAIVTVVPRVPPPAAASACSRRQRASPSARPTSHSSYIFSLTASTGSPPCRHRPCPSVSLTAGLPTPTLDGPAGCGNSYYHPFRCFFHSVPPPSSSLGHFPLTFATAPSFHFVPSLSTLSNPSVWA